MGFLSSDILEAQFGPTRIEVLFQNNDQRVIQTLSTSGQVLEISLVDFDPVGTAAYSAVHQLIIQGTSIGKAFQSADILFHRRILSVVQREIPAVLAERFGSQNPASVVRVGIYVGEKNVHYADIFEIYHPEVTWPEDYS